MILCDEQKKVAAGLEPKRYRPPDHESSTLPVRHPGGLVVARFIRNLEVPSSNPVADFAVLTMSTRLLGLVNQLSASRPK